MDVLKSTTMVKKVRDGKAKKQTHLLGPSTIDADIRGNPLAFNVLKICAQYDIRASRREFGQINYE